MKEKSKTAPKRLIICAVVLGAVLVAASFAAWRLYGAVKAEIGGGGRLDAVRLVTIPAGANVAGIAAVLEDEGIVGDARVFRYYTTYASKRENALQAGDYHLSGAMSYDEILERLISGDAVFEERSVTLPEGSTLWEIAQKLEDAGVCTQADFMRECEEGEYDYWFVRELPQNPLRYRRLEGYLFPDTYRFYPGEDAHSVVEKFLANLEKKLDASLLAQIRASSLSFDELLTFASIVQLEAVDTEQMLKMSSVFHNRLDRPGVFPRLESDVTTGYVNQDIRKSSAAPSEAMCTAYDTYKGKGLPPGPVCSPGYDALYATLNPADTPYFFFVCDTNLECYYAVTADEHYWNVRYAQSIKPNTK